MPVQDELNRLLSQLDANEANLLAHLVEIRQQRAQLTKLLQKINIFTPEEQEAINQALNLLRNS